MTPRHHASEDTLLAFATGHLSSGATLATAVHLKACGPCARTVRLLEQVGGALLEEEPAEPLEPGALERVLKALNEPPPKVAAVAGGRAALEGHPIGRWRWAGPGFRMAPLRGSKTGAERVFLLEGKAGAKLPRHGHRGPERIAVLRGAYHVGDEVFAAGDFAEADDACTHDLMVGPDANCVCLVVTEGRLRFAGPARLIQPFLRI